MLEGTMQDQSNNSLVCQEDVEELRLNIIAPRIEDLSFALLASLPKAKDLLGVSEVCCAILLVAVPARGELVLARADNDLNRVGLGGPGG